MPEMIRSERHPAQAPGDGEMYCIGENVMLDPHDYVFLGKI